MFGFGGVPHAGGLLGIVGLLLAFGVGYVFARSPEDGGKRLYQLYVHGASFFLLIVLIGSAMTIARGLGDLVASSGQYEDEWSIELGDSGAKAAPNQPKRKFDERRTAPPEPRQIIAPGRTSLAPVGRLITGLLMGVFALLLFLFHWKRIEELRKAWSSDGI